MPAKRRFPRATVRKGKNAEAPGQGVFGFAAPPPKPHRPPMFINADRLNQALKPTTPRPFTLIERIRKNGMRVDELRKKLGSARQISELFPAEQYSKDEIALIETVFKHFKIPFETEKH